MAQTRGKERDHVGIAGARVKGERMVRIAGGRVRVRSMVNVSGRVRARAGAGRDERLLGCIAFSTFKEGLLEAASKVSSNQWGNRDRAANRRAGMEEAFKGVGEVSGGACGPVVACGLVRCIEGQKATQKRVNDKACIWAVYTDMRGEFTAQHAVNMPTYITIHVCGPYLATTCISERAGIIDCHVEVVSG
jgi:hypothetical protein|tara:strand:- start:650 stop:1222 length:573 start_codon:yes stop_codon:yes gene_type:complete